MVSVEVKDDTVIFEVQGWDKLWAFKSQLTIPTSNIKNVYPDSDCAMGWLDGIKLLGTALPNIFKAGSFYQEGKFVFWDVRHPQNAIGIELENEHFSKLVIEVEAPNLVIDLLKQSMKG